MELARLYLGLSVALFLPLGIVSLKNSYIRSPAFTAFYSLYSAGPILRPWQSAVLCSLAAFGSGCVVYQSSIFQTEQSANSDSLISFDEATEGITWLARWRAKARDIRKIIKPRSALTRPPVIFTLVLLFATLAIYGAHIFRELQHAWANDVVALTISGLLAAAFVANEIILFVVRPLLKKLTSAGEDLSKLVPNSKYIGWIERALVFAFVVGGQSEAAVLAITAKSLARLPDISEHEEGFIEYFIVGTLASLLVATFVAIFVRVALGKPPW